MRMHIPLVLGHVHVHVRDTCSFDTLFPQVMELVGPFLEEVHCSVWAACAFTAWGCPERLGPLTEQGTPHQ